jgi:hypothetical protein
MPASIMAWKYLNALKNPRYLSISTLRVDI